MFCVSCRVLPHSQAGAGWLWHQEDDDHDDHRGWPCVSRWTHWGPPDCGRGCRVHPELRYRGLQQDLWVCIKIAMLHTRTDYSCKWASYWVALPILCAEIQKQFLRRHIAVIGKVWDFDIVQRMIHWWIPSSEPFAWGKFLFSSNMKNMNWTHLTHLLPEWTLAGEMPHESVGYSTHSPHKKRKGKICSLPREFKVELQSSDSMQVNNWLQLPPRIPWYKQEVHLKSRNKKQNGSRA